MRFFLCSVSAADASITSFTVDILLHALTAIVAHVHMYLRVPVCLCMHTWSFRSNRNGDHLVYRKSPGLTTLTSTHVFVCYSWSFFFLEAIEMVTTWSTGRAQRVCEPSVCL